MENECSIQDTPSSITYAMRFRTNEAHIGQDIQRSMEYLHQSIARSSARIAGYPFVCFHNMNFEDWDLEVAIPISNPIAETDGFFIGIFPGCRMATTIHRGPLHLMKASYFRLSRWMDDQGLQAIGPIYEVYMNNPRDLPPDQIFAGLMVPIRG